MSLLLSSPEKTIESIVSFLKHTFELQQKEMAVVAVSGGIDSALSLALLARALPKEQITPVILPYGHVQSIADNQAICDHLGIPKEQQQVLSIAPVVDAASSLLMLPEHERVRRGNLMARARMMLVFDIAKEKNGLVCGTENKSEHYLGYYTRFGDGASDIEPIVHLYKSQVRQLAEYLLFPTQFLTKAPSAGLWQGQTDEEEMGFSYEQADQVLEQLVDRGIPAAEIHLDDIPDQIVQAVIQQVRQNRFKFHVPYVLQ